MNRDEAALLIDRLHEAQNEFYGCGSGTILEQLLAPGVTWTVPGESPIAGTYRGVSEVLAYFRRRRDLAGGTLRISRGEVLVGEGNRIAALADGFAAIGGVERGWSTVGIYEVVDGRIVACRLLPLDQGAFDAIWSSGQP